MTMSPQKSTIRERAKLAMPDTNTGASSAESPKVVVSGLSSSKSIKRLEQVSSLRARGLNDTIDLPQLVVCGDQSAGKSSVLEGLTQIPFPRDDGVCTKFPSEVILEHTEGPTTITATIIPHVSREKAVRVDMQAFSRSISGFKELPSVIADAGALMGIRGYGSNEEGPAFAEDVLCIRVSGPTGLHLSIVDLPGLISNTSEGQTESDVATVHRMVDSYINKPRTIILAVVQASNDISNQSIISKAKSVDKDGQRTIGIITKPDLINKGLEPKLASLAQNQGTTRLKLGFFLLKNPAPHELALGMTPEDRVKSELNFFQSASWREQALDPNRVGISNLRVYLQNLLDQHIERELPKVRDEIKTMIKLTERSLARIPKARGTVAHLRTFLSDLAMKYHNLTLAATNGDYHSSNASFFASTDDLRQSTRLRAVIHDMNTGFADDMREHGHSLEVRSKVDLQHSPKDSNKSDSENSSNVAALTPTYVTKEEVMDWIKKAYQKTRGRELPGNFNHVLLTELFHHQSKSWPDRAANHLELVNDIITTFVHEVIRYLDIEEHVLAEIQETTDSKFQELKKSAADELAKICEDEERQPITYNHYYTDNIQKARLDTTQDMIKQAVHKYIGEGKDTDDTKFSMTIAKVIDGIQGQVIVKMDEQACSEALAGLNAYYKVALKTFVDNVCRQVIERHLMNKLPDVFSPQTVAGYSDQELERIAGEKPETVAKRARLEKQLTNWKAALEELRK